MESRADNDAQACILVSAWSAGNSYCYIGARIIVAMAVDRQLPQCFSRVNKRGVPYYAVIASFLFGPLAYLSERLRLRLRLCWKSERTNANDVPQV